MTLFHDTEIFSPGITGKNTITVPDAILLRYDNFFTKQESDNYYNTLLNQTPWREYQMPMYDKTVTAPRMISWYEEKDNPGADPNGPDWTPELLAISARVQFEIGKKFNAVLLNLYRNGKDGVAWHSDKEGKIGRNPTIASVTFGETRMFKLRHKTNKEIPQLEIPLHHGTLLVMSGTTNTFWEHHIPKTAKQVLPRINLTFRQVNRQAGQ